MPCHIHSCMYMTVGRDSEGLEVYFFVYVIFNYTNNFLQFLQVTTMTIPPHNGKKGPLGLQEGNGAWDTRYFFFVFLTFTNYEPPPLSNSGIFGLYDNKTAPWQGTAPFLLANMRWETITNIATPNDNARGLICISVLTQSSLVSFYSPFLIVLMFTYKLQEWGPRGILDSWCVFFFFCTRYRYFILLCFLSKIIVLFI